MNLNQIVESCLEADTVIKAKEMVEGDVGEIVYWPKRQHRTEGKYACNYIKRVWSAYILRVDINSETGPNNWIAELESDIKNIRVKLIEGKML